MSQNPMPEFEPLADFDQRRIELEGVQKTVYVQGHGPGIIVMPEMPGVSPHVVRFARWVAEAGFRVYLPSLFGHDGAVGTAEEGAAVFQRACISAEFNALRRGASSPVTRWLRALARQAHDECGGPGVGAIGMCFTGNFALSMMVEPAVLAPVLSQPTLPLRDPAGLEISEDELQFVRRRLENEDLRVLAYRFEGDPLCTAQRFQAYQEALGPRFEGRVLPDERANPDVPPFFSRHVPAPHSVVTVHLIDRDGEPTRSAVNEILTFFRQNLSPTA
ncbi:dienelactone hydrolase [Deinococcus sp. Arct2-2]|nr:dienelactone hydrolase [Deinococcus sp. Arct2-2]